MGGAIDIVSSTLGLAQQVRPDSRESAQTAALRAEREAMEAEQLEEEAEDRRKDRRQLTEARERQRKRRAAEKSEGQTLLTNGGVGYVEDPNLYVPTLKQTFGE